MNVVFILAAVAAIILAAASLPLLIMLCVSVLSFIRSREYAKQGVPGTAWRPLVGDLLWLGAIRRLHSDYFVRAPLEAARWAARCSGMPAHAPVPQDIFMFFGPELRLRLMSPARLRDVLVTHAAVFAKPSIMQTLLSPLLGTGLLLAEGDVWRAHRRLINPSFHYDALKSMLPLMARAANDAIARNYSDASGDDAACIRDVHVDMSALTLDVIGQAAFGRAFVDKATSARVYTTVHDLLTSIVSYLFNLTAFLPGFGAYLRVRHGVAIGRMRSILRNAIADRRALRARTHASDAAHPATAEMLLDLLLDARDDGVTAAGSSSVGAALSDDEVMDESMTFILAGHETTAQALTWTLMLLAQHPDWKARAQAAVRSVVGSDAIITHEHLQALPMLTWILNESMRLFPPVAIIARVATQDVVFADGLRVSAGTGVSIPIALLHRDPNAWGPDADDFKPERWEAGASFPPGKHAFSFMPFSAGPRNCVGTQFATMEARVLLACLLRDCDWALLPAVHPRAYVHSPMLAITLRPEHGMPMRIWRVGKQQQQGR